MDFEEWKVESRKWKVDMKRMISFWLVALLGAAAVSAGVKSSAKSSAASQESAVQEVTVLVMDSTQSLLNGAEVKVGKKVFTTSFDGRVVLRSAQLGSARSITVSCEGYKEQTVPVGSKLLVVKLEAKKQKAPKEHYSGVSVRATREGAVYKTAMLSASYAADEAGMVEEMAVVDRVSAKPMAGGAVVNNVSAGKLTAGEVNDFAKWYFWPNILDKTHAQFVRTWGIEPRQRYTVQVMNKNGYPIANYPVSLTDGKNTLFQTVTDNTGKAELWGNLIIGAQQSRVQAPDTLIVLDEPCDLSNAVDVMFVFDATGSMGDELRYLQAEMKDVIARATDATGGLAIRTGAVVYRDHGDEYITRLSRLTSDIKTTQTFIDKQCASGGGDYPEAVPEALMAALNSVGWDSEARARIAFLILDAPCHQDSATLAMLHDQVLNAAAMGVRIVPVVCSGIGESGEYLLRSIALATNGTSFFLTDDSGIGNKHLKPTTDSLKVEHLNDMLVRTIVEFSYMPDCTGHWHEEEIANIEEQFIPNPFTAAEVEQYPSIPHGPTTLYLLDVSGKLIYVYQGNLDEAGDSQLSRLPLSLTTGVYFVKAFYDGEWHTKKILVH